MTPELQALADTIEIALSKKAEHFVKHPAEIKLLQEMSDDELREFAHERGWNAARRLGGMQVQFYNDNNYQRAVEDNAAERGG